MITSRRGSRFIFNRLTRTEVTFALTIDGHHFGVVNPPDQERRYAYQIHIRHRGDKYLPAHAFYGRGDWREGGRHGDPGWRRDQMTQHRRRAWERLR